MIEYIFGRIVILSAVGALLSLILLAIRPLTKRVFSSKWHYYTYVTAMLVFLLPLSISLPSSNNSSSGNTAPAVTDGIQQENKFENSRIIVITKGKSDFSLSKADTAVGSQISRKPYDLKAVSVQISKYAFFIWLFGFSLYISFSVISHFTFKKNAARLSKKESKMLCDKASGTVLDVTTTEYVSSPVLVGIFRQQLFIPDTDFTETDINNILLHECVHARRRDVAVKWLCLFAKAIHWFNPIIHILSRQIDIECEISCDKAATASLDTVGIKNYCETILSLISVKDDKSSTALCAGGTKKSLERRFKAIMEKKTTSKKVAAISVIIAVLLTLTAITASAIFGGKAKDESKKNNNISSDASNDTESVKVEIPDGEIKVFETSDNEADDEAEAETNTVIYRVINSDDEIASLKVAENQNVSEESDVEYRLIPDAEDDGMEISAEFDEERHPAVDYRLEAGTSVASPFDGEVTVAEYTYDKGNYVEILCSDGTTSVLFAHLEKMNVSSGDKVNAGDIIGTVGTTGMSTGPHLHVEYYENGQAVNPVKVFFTEENGEIAALFSQPELITDN